jgi:hypothetical protein
VRAGRPNRKIQIGGSQMTERRYGRFYLPESLIAEETALAAKILFSIKAVPVDVQYLCERKFFLLPGHH